MVTQSRIAVNERSEFTDIRRGVHALYQSMAKKPCVVPSKRHQEPKIAINNNTPTSFTFNSLHHIQASIHSLLARGARKG